MVYVMVSYGSIGHSEAYRGHGRKFWPGIVQVRTNMAL